MPGFHHHAYWPAPEEYEAYTYGTCQEDGHNCLYSRCCAREGSRCYVKNEHWATCSQTCLKFTRWEGSYPHGHWVHTSYPVWDCADITDDAPDKENDADPKNDGDRRLHSHHHHHHHDYPWSWLDYGYGSSRYHALSEYGGPVDGAPFAY